MIGLNDFVKETLVQIATGVQEAQDALADADALINPPAGGELAQQEGTYPVTHRRLAHLIELDIAVTSSEEGRVVVAAAGGNAEAAAVSRLRFKVGVAFPMSETTAEPVPEDPSFELEV